MDADRRIRVHLVPQGHQGAAGTVRGVDDLQLCAFLDRTISVFPFLQLGVGDEGGSGRLAQREPRALTELADHVPEPVLRGPAGVKFVRSLPHAEPPSMSPIGVSGLWIHAGPSSLSAFGPTTVVTPRRRERV